MTAPHRRPSTKTAKKPSDPMDVPVSDPWGRLQAQSNIPRGLLDPDRLYPTRMELKLGDAVWSTAVDTDDNAVVAGLVLRTVPILDREGTGEIVDHDLIVLTENTHATWQFHNSTALRRGATMRRLLASEVHEDCLTTGQPRHKEGLLTLWWRRCCTGAAMGQRGSMGHVVGPHDDDLFEAAVVLRRELARMDTERGAELRGARSA